MGKAEAVMRRVKVVRRALVEDVWGCIMADWIEDTVVVCLP